MVSWKSGSEKELFEISLSYQSMEGPIGKAKATDTVAVTPCFEQVAENWDSWDTKMWNLDSKNLFDKACKPPTANVNGRSMSSGPPDQCCGSSYPDMKPFNTQSHTCTDSHILPLNSL